MSKILDVSNLIKIFKDNEETSEKLKDELSKLIEELNTLEKEK